MAIQSRTINKALMRAILPLAAVFVLITDARADLQLAAYGGSRHRARPRGYTYPVLQAPADAVIFENAADETADGLEDSENAGEEDPEEGAEAEAGEGTGDQNGTDAIPVPRTEAETQIQTLPAGVIDNNGAGAPAPAYEPVRPRPVNMGEGTIVLNFSDTNLRDVIRTISEIVGHNFILAPGVNAKISVQTAKPVPRKDVFGIFESILDLNGLAAVKTGQYYKIVPAASAKQYGLGLLKDRKDIPAGDGFVNLVVPIEFISSGELVQLLKPMTSPSGNIINFSKTNTLIITDTVSNANKLAEMINILDVDAFEKMNIAVVPVRNVDVKTFGKELNDIFLAMGMGKESAQLSVVPVERLNSFIVFSPSAQLLDSARKWIEKLDTSSQGEGQSAHIYYVRNDKAANIKGVLDQLYGIKGAAAPQPAPGAQIPKADPLSTDVKIFLYEPSNALIIYSSQHDYARILSTIEELDRVPKQVLIDALIAEVKLDDETKYGVQWSVLSGKFNIQQNTGLAPALRNNPAGTITAPIGQAAPMGLDLFATDAKEYFAIVQALASSGKINVLSNPHIAVKNYEKASINIGSDEPVATQSAQTAVTGTAGIIQNIEYRKTGVILTVTPHITEAGMVALTIRQEVSDKSTDRTVGNAIYPSFTKREAETSVVARDRETLLIGGLIQERNNKSASGVPLLSKIPVLGSLFRYTTKTEGKTELIILLTPTVISEPDEARAVTLDMKNRLGGIKEFFEKRAKERRE